MSNANQMDDESWDLFWYGLGAVVLVGPIVLWNRLIDVLVDRHVLVAATHRPVVEIPQSGGAGLDAGRLVLLVGLLVGGAAAAWVITRRRNERTEQPR